MLCKLLHLLSQENLILTVKKSDFGRSFFYTVFIEYIIGACLMNIVWIHGMNQQHKTARTLLQHWLVILQQVLSELGRADDLPYLQRHSRLAFYGDLLTRQHLENTLNASTLMPQHWSPFSFLHPIHLTHTAAPNIEHQAEISKNPQLTISDELSFNNKIKYISLLGKDLALRDLASLINHFPELHSSFIHRFLMEAYLYLSNPHFIHTVHTRLHEHLHGTKPNIVIAHSLGSVIAYNYLIQHPELKIQALITLGSPLAFRVIQCHLQQPIQRPAALYGDWINFYSDADFLSAFPLNQKPFAFTPAIINKQITTDLAHPHLIEGYLHHPEFINNLLSLLKKSA